MINFSDERVEGIANTIFSELQKLGLLKKESVKKQVISSVKKAYIKFYRFNEDLEKMVREKIKSMSNCPPEGTSQYKVLFEKKLLDEWKKY
jgi:hypothetical protein